MTISLRDHLAQKHHFREWERKQDSEQALLTKGYFLSPWQVPGWQALRNRTLAASDGPARNVTYLSDSSKRSSRGMTVSVQECASLQAAHERLLSLLAEFQTIELTRDSGTCGDVCFASPGRQATLFARGNLVFLVQRAERGEVPVFETAVALDGQLVNKHTQDVKVLPELRTVRTSEDATERGVVCVDVDVEDPLKRPVWLRFAATGELWLGTDSRVRVRAAPDISSSIEVVVYNENGGTAEQRASLR